MQQNVAATAANAANEIKLLEGKKNIRVPSQQTDDLFSLLLLKIFLVFGVKNVYICAYLIDMHNIYIYTSDTYIRNLLGCQQHRNLTKCFKKLNKRNK